MLLSTEIGSLVPGDRPQRAEEDDRREDDERGSDERLGSAVGAAGRLVEVAGGGGVGAVGHVDRQP